MQLKYEMREESHRLVAVDLVYHDAAYAHALVMAMADVKQQKNMLNAIDSVWYIENRAEHLMREWGYVEVDDGGG